MDRTTLEVVFQPFAQGHANGDRSRGGPVAGPATGEGLIELHGGQITAHSGGPGRDNLTFAILLPLDQQQEVTGSKNATPRP